MVTDKNSIVTFRMLFELLVLSGAQVGSDWTSTLKKRLDFRLDSDKKHFISIISYALIDTFFFVP